MDMKKEELYLRERGRERESYCWIDRQKGRRADRQMDIWPGRCIEGQTRWMSREGADNNQETDRKGREIER